MIFDWITVAQDLL